MNEVLKQRLVGALILVALGVVFWPIIFVEPKDQRTALERSIPASPDVDTAPVAVPDVAGLRPSPPLPARNIELAAGDVQDEADTGPAQLPERPQPVADPEARPEAATVAAAPIGETRSTTRSEAPVKPEIDADGVPVAWMLQVASLSSEERARQLKSELLAIDQEAYVKKVRRDDRVLWRVYIGPKFEKERLEAVQPRVDAAAGVSSRIMRYYP
ncbi:MAG: SPOR domain-containing protein [Pseudomonadota bacterium]